MCCVAQHKQHNTVPAVDVALSERARLQQTLIGFDETAHRLSASARRVRERAVQIRAVGEAGQARVEAVRAELHAAVDARCDQLSASLRCTHILDCSICSMTIRCASLALPLTKPARS